MHYYKANIQYEGTNYAGFQWQNGPLTVQSEFNKALGKLLDGKVTTMAASRTDTGVHAMDQVVKITSNTQIHLSSFLDAFNELLPQDIRCISINACEGSFKPAAQAVSKEYRYFFTNNKNISKKEHQFITNISPPLEFDAMVSCTQALMGIHDFCNFYSSGSNVKSTVRNIFSCELSKVNPHEQISSPGLFGIPRDLSDCYQLKIEANGFLKQMIRHILSALWMVGSGKISVDEFRVLLNGPENLHQRWKVAPPNGLFLYRINYA